MLGYGRYPSIFTKAPIKGVLLRMKKLAIIISPLLILALVAQSQNTSIVPRIPAYPGVASQYLDGTGQWSTPAGGSTLPANSAGYLKNNGTGTLSWDTPAGSGDVTKGNTLTNLSPVLGGGTGTIYATNVVGFMNAIGTAAVQAVLNSVYQGTNSALTALAGNPALYQATNSVLTRVAGIGAGTSGDIIFRDAAGWTNLAKGVDNKVLKLISGLPSWQTDDTGGTGVAGTVINTGASTTAQYAKYSDTSGTNVVPDTITLASADFANQGTTTTLLHGNAAGNPSWGAVDLATAQVTGVLPAANVDTALARRIDPPLNLSGTSVDLSLTNEWYSKSLSANTTLTFANPTAGRRFMITITNGASWTITFPTVTWASGSAPVLDTGAGKVNHFGFAYDGTTYYGDVSQNSSAILNSIAALANGTGALTNNGSGTFGYYNYSTDIAAKQDSDADLTRLAGIGTGTAGDVIFRDAVGWTNQASGSITNTFTNKTFDAAGAGNILKQTKYITFMRPDWGDGTGAVPQTNTFTVSGLMHYTFSGNAETNANYVVYEGVVPPDIDTSVDMTATFAWVGGGTDADTVTWHIAYGLGVAGSAYPVTLGAVATSPLAFAAVTPTTPAAGDYQTTAALTLTGWAASMTPGTPLLISIRRLQDSNDDTARDLYLRIAYASTQ